MQGVGSERRQKGDAVEFSGVSCEGSSQLFHMPKARLFDEQSGPAVGEFFDRLVVHGLGSGGGADLAGDEIGELAL